MRLGKSIALLAALIIVSMGPLYAGGGAQSSGSGDGVKGDLNLLWLAGMNQTTVIKDMIISDFQKRFPALKVNIDEGPNNDLPQMIMLEATSGVSIYDVVMDSASLPQLVNINALYPLDDYIKRDNFDINKMVDNGIRYKDHVYGIPVRYDAFLFHWNEDQFRAAGLDPDKPPQTWDDLREYGKKLTQNGHYGLSKGFGNDILSEMYISILYSLGGELCDAANNPVFNNAIGLEALNILIDWLNGSKIVNPAATGWNYSEEIAGYLSGEAAMFIHYPARYIDANFKPDRSSIIGKSRVAPMWGKAVLTKGYYALMFRTGKNHDAAWEFLKWLADAGVQKQVILAGGDCNPTNLDTLNDPELQAKYASLRAISQQFNMAKPYPLNTQSRFIYNTFNKYFNMAALGTMTPQAALDASTSDIRKALIDVGDLKP
jgi:ABC-type glycerol-3-phosphate transport system substrate-binding protein